MAIAVWELSRRLDRCEQCAGTVREGVHRSADSQSALRVGIVDRKIPSQSTYKRKGDYHARQYILHHRRCCCRSVHPRLPWFALGPSTGLNQNWKSKSSEDGQSLPSGRARHRCLRHTQFSAKMERLTTSKKIRTAAVAV
jgi:hypothetical protein